MTAAPEGLAGLVKALAPVYERLEVEAKHKGGYRVINPDGDAELGNWIFAECWWKQAAEAIAELPNIRRILSEILAESSPQDLLAARRIKATLADKTAEHAADRMATNLEHWRQECSKLHSRVATLTAQLAEAQRVAAEAVAASQKMAAEGLRLMDWRRDCGILLAQVDYLCNATGESLDAEDYGLVEQIRADLLATNGEAG